MLLYSTVKISFKNGFYDCLSLELFTLLTTDNLVGAKDPRTLASIKEQDNSEV